jgi:hypothetical protein
MIQNRGFNAIIIPNSVFLTTTIQNRGFITKPQF